MGCMALFLFPALLTAPPASLKDLAFLAGNWQGGSGENVIEEYWMAPEGGAMLGMYRDIQGGKTVMTELCAVVMREGSPVLLLRHFDSGLIGREERDKPIFFGLESLAGRKAVFYSEERKTRLTYERTTDSELVVTLEKEKDGKKTQFPYRYRLMTR
jgi:hypothetical protein